MAATVERLTERQLRPLRCLNRALSDMNKFKELHRPLTPEEAGRFDRTNSTAFNAYYAATRTIVRNEDGELSITVSPVRIIEASCLVKRTITEFFTLLKYPKMLDSFFCMLLISRMVEPFVLK